jgi:hypothetical protein
MHRTCLIVCLLLVQAAAPAVAGADGNVPPEAEAGLDQHVDRGATVLLDGGASWDPDGEIASYEWEIRAPNGTRFHPACGNCEESQFVPRRVGTYTVTLTVRDDDGATRSDTMFVDVESTGGPSVDLTLVTTDGTAGEFRANATAGDHELDRLVWRVDGRRVETDNVTGGEAIVDRRLEFATNGTHNVTVTVADWLGNRANDTSTVGIGGDGSSKPPTISITRAPAILEVGESGRFVASASDPDGGPVTVAWPEVDETNRSMRAAFGEEGRKTVTAIATDDEGDQATDTVNVTVLNDTGGNNDPVVRISHHPSRTLSPGESGTFVATASDPDGDPVSLSWSNRDSGDTTSMSWANEGTKTVSVTARDGNGGTDTDSVTVEVASSGEGPNLSIRMVHSPETLEVGENGTFKAAVRVNGDRESVPITWESGEAAGQTATFVWNSPGTRTVSATASYNSTLNRTVTTSVEVLPRSGPVADMLITPKCAEERSQKCGPVTGNPQDPIELSAAPSKEGGGTIESYTWTINGSHVSNRKVFQQVYDKGPKHVVLTVEDEHGETDTSNRTFYVRGGYDTDVSIELADSISKVCPEFTDQCSWDASAKELTVVDGATSTFEGNVLGDPGSSLSLQWIIPSMARSNTLRKHGRTQTITWASTGGPATLKLSGYQSEDRDQRVAWDAVTVEVVEKGNQDPGVTIDDVHEVCNEDGTRVGSGCSKTDAVEITYAVWDPDPGDEVTVDGFLAPENEHVVANEKVSASRSTFTTQEIPVTTDGEHNFRVTVTDGQATNQTERAFHIVNATGGGDESGGGTVVDGDWLMDIQTREAGASAKAKIEVTCNTENESTKCPGERVTVNWGDGDQQTLTDDYENGSQTWSKEHFYNGQGYPTLSIVVLNDQDASVTTMQRYLDLEDAEDYENWKFDTFVKTFGDKPGDHEDSGVWYMDEEDIDERTGSATWVTSKNHSILNDDWIRSIDERKSDWTSTGKTTWDTVAPYCSGECVWSPTGDERSVRGSHVSTEWYDTRKSGLAWQKVAEGQNVLDEGQWKIIYRDGSSATGDSCDPTDFYVKKCKKIGDWSGTDYKYKRYRIKHESKYEKKTYDKEWKVQKYFQKAYERWVNVG